MRIKKMINLDPSGIIGKGYHRECYVHPENNNLCIKIVVLGDLKESQREQQYYRLLQNRNTPWEILPEFHGVVETNLGSGAVFDLIRDYDGNVSKTMVHYLTSAGKPDTSDPGLLEAIDLLKLSLYKHTIITMTLKPKNIVYKKLTPEKGRLIIIDNIGNSDFIPICNYNTFLARIKISRKWRKFKSTYLAPAGYCTL
jgi:hypothetical protein